MVLDAELGGSAAIRNVGHMRAGVRDCEMLVVLVREEAEFGDLVVLCSECYMRMELLAKSVFTH